MGRLKRFFKHKFVIVSLCFILIGALALTIMTFIPKAKTYTNKDTVEYEYMGEKVIYRLTFEDDKNYYIDYVNEQGKVVQEKAISGTYEIKDGILYSALGKWGTISVYGIDVKFGGVLDAGYECKPAKYARLAFVAFIVLGGLMFVLAAYVGITKKKTKVAVAPAPANPLNGSAPSKPSHNPHARKLPQGARKLPRLSQARVTKPQANNTEIQGNNIQPQSSNIMQSYNTQNETTYNEPVNNQSYYQNNVNNQGYIEPTTIKDNNVDYVEQQVYIPINEEESDAYEDLVNAIEQEAELEEYNRNLANNEPFINIQTPENNVYLGEDFDPMEMDPMDKKDDEN